MARWLVWLRTRIHSLFVVEFVRLYYNKVWGMHIGEGTRISLSVKLDKTNPGGVSIGKYTALTFDSTVLAHDFVNRVHHSTSIGSFCFIGARAVIMPGISIGDHCIVGPGSVVMRNVPDGCVIMGNPGRVMEQGIRTGNWGQRIRDELDTGIVSQN